jgi:hypothetical protein
VITWARTNRAVSFAKFMNPCPAGCWSLGCTQAQHAVAQDAEISSLKAQLTEIHAALIALQLKDQLVAQR